MKEIEFTASDVQDLGDLLFDYDFYPDINLLNDVADKMNDIYKKKIYKIKNNI